MGDKDDALDALARGQEAEIDESAAIISVGVVSGPNLRGALVWGIVGLVVGAALAVPFTLVVDDTGAPRWVFAVAFAAAGALGLSSATFLLGAGRQAVKEGETTPADPTAVVRVDTDADHADEVIELLIEESARRADFIAAPVGRPPSDDVEDPRSLPDDRDTTHGSGVEYDAGFRSDVG